MIHIVQEIQFNITEEMIYNFLMPTYKQKIRKHLPI
jgi:hypothetical protein